MSPGPPVAALATATPSSTALLAPETLSQILSFAVYDLAIDRELEVAFEYICPSTLNDISLVCTLWREVAAPLQFQTPGLTYDPFEACRDLVPFQRDPSLAMHVRSLRLSLCRGSFKLWDGETTGDGRAEEGPQVEDWRPLTEWMATLKNLAYLRLDLFQVDPESYASWPLDAFPNVRALYISSIADSLFTQSLITRMPALKSLFLSSDGYLGFDSPAQHFVPIDTLPNSRCVTRLFLDKSDISASAFRQLVETSGRTLEVLEVYRAAEVEDDDLAHALDVAPGIKRLKWFNLKTDPMNDTILPLSPSLLRALSTSHITNLDLHPWPTAAVLEALPDTLIKLKLGTIQSYPGNRQSWWTRSDPEFKQVLEDTITAVLDARDVGRFPSLKKMEGMMGKFEKLDSVLLRERAERMGLQVGW